MIKEKGLPCDIHELARDAEWTKGIQEIVNNQSQEAIQKRMDLENRRDGRIDKDHMPRQVIRRRIKK